MVGDWMGTQYDSGGRRYDYRLKFVLRGRGTGLERLRITHDIQHSQRALPALGQGRNRISFSAGPAEGTITWFDANGWKLAGYHRTYGQIQHKDSWEQFQAYLEDPAKNPPPDGYRPPFYKADRIGEYRQAYAAFTERMKRAAP